MGAKIGKLCFIFYKHSAGGVVKNTEYSLGNVTDFGLSLPLMNSTFPKLTSAMCIVDGNWNNPSGATAALQISSDGKISWVSSYTHSAAYTYMGFIAYIAK